MSVQQSQYDVNDRTLYRDHYRSTVKWLGVFGMLAVALALILGYMSVTREQPSYYASTTTGEVIPLHSLSEPVITQQHMLMWSSLAVRAAYNLDFANYKQQLDSAEQYFTPAGFDKFQQALKDDDVLSTLIDQKLDMSAVVTDTPVVLNTAILNGRYTWRVQMPVLVTFTSASETRKLHMTVTMNVQRVPSLSAPSGIQVSDFLSQRVEGG
ncbi:MAG: type IVB secretion system apparatus protein IcmL/DotI [Gammaproteobacteria bacterium]|nr:type IVB secretion system apparatus protein IcmL/DotI [Gammaproteobacteria bacterium]MCH9744097.1 type IVB secretion system apparatus protein IcmL/DotI [Gammaproteobacteria bacterium]